MKRIKHTLVLRGKKYFKILKIRQNISSFTGSRELWLIPETTERVGRLGPYVFFHHILILHNHSKTHTLTFSLILILKIPNKKVSVFFIICMANKLSGKNFCSVIIWFWHQIVSCSFCCDKFNFSMFSYIVHSFSENCIIH